ncbi:unnamed protein product [Parajaminaea phylloscopi]
MLADAARYSVSSGNNDRKYPTSGQGPFEGPGGSRDRLLFAKVKPFCIDLLAQSRPGPTVQSPRVAELLRNLRTLLEQAIDPCPLPDPESQDCALTVNSGRLPLRPAVLHYIFFPITQLFQACPRGPADLPDRTRLEAFACLELLCREWWIRWQLIGSAPSSSTTAPVGSQEAFQMWRQLLTLGAITLAGPPQRKGGPEYSQSPETSFAALRFLLTLLMPRKVEAASKRDDRRQSESANGQDWEWDGESDLPIFSDEEKSDGPRQRSHTSKSNAADIPTEEIVYPVAEHRAKAAEPAVRARLAHILGAALELVVETIAHSSTVTIRATALSLSTIILEYWLPANASDPCQRAERLAPVVPGAVSKIVRFCAGGSATVSDIPGDLVARALALLRVVLVTALNDSVTETIRKEVSLEAGGGKNSVRFEAVFGRADADDVGRSGDEISGADTGTSLPSANSKPAQHVATMAQTLHNVAVGFASMDGLGQSRAGSRIGLTSHGNPVALQAVIRLASALLSRCGKTLQWFEESQESPAPSLIRTLSRWLLDLSHGGNESTSSSVERAAGDALKPLLVNSSACLVAMQAEASLCLQELPASISQIRNDRVALLGHRLAALAHLSFDLLMSPTGFDPARRLTRLKEPAGWGMKLIDALQLSSGLAAESTGSTASSQLSMPLPHLYNLESQTTRQIADMLQAWGRAQSRLFVLARTRDQPGPSDLSVRPEDQLQTARWFVYEAHLQRSFCCSPSATVDVSALLMRKAAAATFVARELLRGMVDILEESQLSLQTGKSGRRIRKEVSALANDIVGRVLQDWEADEGQNSRSDQIVDLETRARQGESASATQLTYQDSTSESSPVERLSGVPLIATQDEQTRPTNFGPALSLAYVGAATLSNVTSSAPSGNDRRKPCSAIVIEQMQLFRAMQLDLLSLAAQLLGGSFQKHLSSVLYPLVSALTHPSQEIALAADRAILGIASSAGYSEPSSLVQDNVDYILGEASWRLVTGLDRELEGAVAPLLPQTEALGSNPYGFGDSKSALVGRRHPSQLSRPLQSARTSPAVLIEVMRLLGPSSLHLIEDSVDEVLDALDRYHAFQDVASSLLGVLDRLMVIMKQAAAIQAGDAAEPYSNSQQDSLVGTRGHGPDLAADASTLRSWLQSRQTGTSERTIDEEVSSAFAAVETPASDEPTASDRDPQIPQTPETRSQKLLVAVLAKALPFLSHDAPALRTLALRLFASGTQLLAPVSSGGQIGGWTRKEEDLLPLINRAWPLVLARLGTGFDRPQSSTGPVRGGKAHQAAGSDSTESTAIVHLEAVRFLEILARHVPQFMCGRIVQEAWPRLQSLLRAQEINENGSHFPPTGLQPRSITFEAASRAVTSHLRSHNDLIAQVSRPLDQHSPLYTLLLAVIRSLVPLVKHEGPAFPQSTLWEILTHPLVCQALDSRQSAELRHSAVLLYQASLLCDGGGTAWYVLGGSSGSGTKPDEDHTAASGKDGGALAMDVSLSARQIFRCAQR